MTTKYVAFLRGINVGGHKIIKMADLKRMFESFGFSNVATFIQSGNVIFESSKSDTGALESGIQARLAKALGYEVEIFVRTIREVYTLVRNTPFLDNAVNTVYVAFLRKAPGRSARKALLALANPVDEFEVRGREVYWLRHRELGESLLSNNLMEKTLGQPATTRNMTSIRKIVDKFG
jgi:uncharacterized protein (DUF1697 family)